MSGSCLDMSESVGRVHDVDAVEVLEVEQVGVAGDDEIGLSGEPTGERGIVGRIAGDGGRNRRRRRARSPRVLHQAPLGRPSPRRSYALPRPRVVHKTPGGTQPAPPTPEAGRSLSRATAFNCGSRSRQTHTDYLLAVVDVFREHEAKVSAGVFEGFRQGVGGLLAAWLNKIDHRRDVPTKERSGRGNEGGSVARMPLQRHHLSCETMLRSIPAAPSSAARRVTASGHAQHHIGMFVHRFADSMTHRRKKQLRALSSREFHRGNEIAIASHKYDNFH